MNVDLQPITWWEALPDRLGWELRAMANVAPDLEWIPHRGYWVGDAPLWPFGRPEPPGLRSFVKERRLKLAVIPSQAHPAVPPRFLPLDPQPGFDQRTLHSWHVNGDGSICMFQQAVDWTGEEPCAAMIPRASGWFLELLLMEADRIDTMTELGVIDDPSLDGLLTPTQGDAK